MALGSEDGRIRANGLEFLEQVLKPQLRGLVLPMIDPQVGADDRVRLANRLVGVPIEGLTEALATLLDSEDSWLKSCAAFTVGDLGLEDLRAALDKWAADEDPLVRETVNAARRKLAREDEAPPDDRGERVDWEATGPAGFG